MVENFKKLPAGVKYAVWGVPVVVVIVILVVILVNLLIPRDYDRVTITNDEVLSEISGGSVNDFRTSLINLLQDEGYVGEDTTVDDVVIREGTVDTFRYGSEGVVTTFIADIDSVRQTYRVKVVDASDEMTDIKVYISCPRADEMKYPGVECKGHYGSTSKSVELYLPHKGVLASGEKYLVKSVTGNNRGEKVLQIYLYSCDASDAEVLAAEAEVAVREFVRSVGDEVEYVYNVRTGYCEGDAI